MPLQNRVTPFGDLVAHPSRAATLIGNRGIIHDPATRTLTGRRWTTRAWIACSCSFKDRHRDVWATRSWTELFFLDEATALAAGHRPCFECRRADALAFADAWARGNGGVRPRAAEIDAALHRQRVHGRGARRHPVTDPDTLPAGTIVAAGDVALLRTGRNWLRWTFDGYAADADPRRIDALLTPPGIVDAIRAGYRPALHPSAA